ncbi:glycosyltransferase family 4 protein [Maribacter sp. SA7]|uniref:glycosyltransferase family 4 protein n=1 Tax=Maribacter zhoushanensis TaxID=3030012 RepID=UPI0023EA9363|nr:glycosyltransferase family 4 protein [Maribacter zhoushanensis]MDF4201842.1 glycosyltransferase family 4 protein [Maribacter zhoushanensis]
MNQKGNLKTIVFCTQVYFLDAAIEYIQLLTLKGYKTHVLIELSPNQLKANILNIDVDLTQYPALTSFNLIVKDWKLENLAPYFKKCVSVNFVVYPTKKIWQTKRVSNLMEKHISKIKPDFIHLDDFSSRTVFSLPYYFFNREKLIANIHDPLTHSGEFQWSREVYRKIWFNLVGKFVVFSEYSKKILEPQLRKSKKIYVLSLMPYTIYKSFLQNNKMVIRDYISFVGRISPYKGVELFVGTFKGLKRNFPNIKFYIGGKTINGYEPYFLNLDDKNVVVENKFLSNLEIAEIINKSKIVICPYIDATQSGVVMTAYGLGCPVLVTNTGGLPEYVIHNSTGVISVEATEDCIESTLNEYLQQNKEERLLENVKQLQYSNRFEKMNKIKMDELYNCN